MGVRGEDRRHLFSQSLSASPEWICVASQVPTSRDFQSDKIRQPVGRDEENEEEEEDPVVVKHLVVYFDIMGHRYDSFSRRTVRKKVASNLRGDEDEVLEDEGDKRVPVTDEAPPHPSTWSILMELSRVHCILSYGAPELVYHLLALLVSLPTIAMTIHYNGRCVPIIVDVVYLAAMMLFITSLIGIFSWAFNRTFVYYEPVPSTVDMLDPASSAYQFYYQAETISGPTLLNILGSIKSILNLLLLGAFVYVNIVIFRTPLARDPTDPTTFCDNVFHRYIQFAVSGVGVLLLLFLVVTLSTCAAQFRSTTSRGEEMALVQSHP